MTNEIKLSVIIPCYNHGIYINEALEELLTYKENSIEIIVVNDGSTDQITNSILTNLHDKGILVLNQENQGLCKSRNNAIRIAQGEYILALDADNIVEPELITKAIQILDNDKTISVVYSDRQNIGNNTDLIRVGEFDIHRLLKGNYIDACAVFRKEVWTIVGGYAEDMPTQGLEDWDFWITIFEKGFNFFYIEQPLFYYRVLSNSMARKLPYDPKYATQLRYIYTKHKVIMNNHFIDEIFQLRNELNQLSLELEKSRKSKAYKLGRMLLKPLTVFR